MSDIKDKLKQIKETIVYNTDETVPRRDKEAWHNLIDILDYLIEKQSYPSVKDKSGGQYA